MVIWKKSALGLVLTSAALLTGMPAAYAAQISAAGYATASTPTSSVNNNFTMLSKSGVFIGGTNDVSMTWDGTVFTDSSDYTGPGGKSNMTLSSPSTFFGYFWPIHDIQVFRPGTYTFDTALGGASPEVGIQTLSVGAGQLGAHMLMAWSGNDNLDISVVWEANGVFGETANQRTLTGATIWNAVSIDGDPATHPGPGIGMPGSTAMTGGPFWGDQPSFNLNGITPAAVPIPGAIWFFVSGIIGLLSIHRRIKGS